jgi:DtxR family Mn-dependent transcriptional regulator
MHSISTQDYLKAIHSLEKPGTLVSTNSIAAILNIKSSSVTEMLGRLEQEGLVERQKYKGVKLTETGKEKAVHILRKHRLWETFLVDKLKFDWGNVHEIAEQLEHVESRELVNKLDTYLGNPKFDPHGEPIPDIQGNITELDIVIMAEAEPGEYLIAIVLDDRKELLNYITRLNFNINSQIRILGKEKYDNSVLIEIDNTNKSISEKVARKIGLITK